MGRLFCRELLFPAWIPRERNNVFYLPTTKTLTSR